MNYKEVYLTKNELFSVSNFFNFLIYVKVHISIKNLQENYVFCGSLKK